MSERTMLIDADGNRYLFDAVFSAAHELSLSVTDHPVQSGAAVADHAYLQPETVTLSVGMSDAMTAAGTLAGESGERSVSAYQKLLELARARRPLTLVTRLETYSNMLIQTVSAEETADSMNALRAEITLKRLNMVQVAEVSVQQTASSSKITYETGADGGSRYGGYVYESYGGTQAACDVPEGTHIEALLWLAGQRGER